VIRSPFVHPTTPRPPAHSIGVPLTCIHNNMLKIPHSPEFYRGYPPIFSSHHLLSALTETPPVNGTLTYLAPGGIIFVPAKVCGLQEVVGSMSDPLRLK
jgi:hypothetical protein